MGSFKETEYLKGVFGDNWREGARKNPHIDRPDPNAVARARQEAERRKTQHFKEAAHEAANEARDKGLISGDQYKTWCENVDRMD